MDPKIVTVIIFIVAVLAVVAILLITRRRKTEHLKQKFGSEYDRLVHQHGDPQRAETVLAAREKRVSHFDNAPTIFRSIIPMRSEIIVALTTLLCVMAGAKPARRIFGRRWCISVPCSMNYLASQA